MSALSHSEIIGIDVSRDWHAGFANHRVGELGADIS